MVTSKKRNPVNQVPMQPVPVVDIMPVQTVSRDEAARFLDCSKRFIDVLVAEKKLRSVTQGRRRRIDFASVREYDRRGDSGGRAVVKR